MTDNGKPRCKCGRVCVYYGPIGGYSKACKACNAYKAVQSKESRLRMKALKQSKGKQ